VLFNGDTWSLPKQVGVYKTDFPSDGVEEEKRYESETKFARIKEKVTGDT